jgi:hypothetical protein
MIKNRSTLNLKQVTAAILLFIGLIGCEQIVEGDLDYEEKMVLYGILENGGKIEGISITHTIPPLGILDTADNNIYNADVEITHNGTIYEATGKWDDEFNWVYGIPEDIILGSGDLISIRAEWKNHLITAETYIPEMPVVDYLTGFLNSDQFDNFSSSYTMYAYIENIDPEDYYIGGIFITQESFNRVNPATGKDGLNKEKILIADNDYYYKDDGSGDNKVDSIQEINELFSIEAYPADFFQYWSTRRDNDVYGDIFSSDGRNPIWNVRGGLGVFFGRSRTSFRSVNYRIETIDPD